MAWDYRRGLVPTAVTGQRCLVGRKFDGRKSCTLASQEFLLARSVYTNESANMGMHRTRTS